MVYNDLWRKTIKMTSNDKKDFGKKPVRRSKSEESEPAKVYRPRTARHGSGSSKTSDDKPFEPEKESPREQRSFEPNRDQGFDKDTGYRRKDTKGSTFNVDRSKKRKDESDSENGSKKVKRIVRKSDSGSRKSSSRDFDKRDGSKPFRSDDKRSKPFDRKDSRDSRDGGIKRSRGPRKDDSFGAERREERQFSKDSRFRKDKPVRKRSENAEFGVQKKLSKKAPLIEAELKTDSEGYIRLNKYVANSGLCSRREADEYIQNGMITVNGMTIDQLGTKVKLTDEIRFKGKELDPEHKVYILLNKPKDFITTVEDPNAKRTVMELIEGACDQRVYPVGRLDRNSTGLLLLTNDGELTKRLTHPSYLKKKVYEVGLDRPLEESDMKLILEGVQLEEETVRADAVEFIDEFDKSNIGVEIHSGQNRVVRRIFDHLGYKVQKLDRVYFAGLTKKNLPRGKWRFLTPTEVTMLKMNRF